MVHPVKTPLGAVRAVTNVSLNAVRHPIQTVEDAAAMGRGLVASVVSGIMPDHSPVAVDMDEAVAEPVASEDGSLKRQGDPVTDAAAERTVTEPSTPTDESPEGEQVVTEPSTITAAGDEEEIPSPAVQPVDEDVEVTTPVGTTGAGAGFNPDTNETDLQQPGTEPLMDPSTTKRIKSQSDTLRKAADPDKG